MFERFTQGARQVVVLAQEEARKLRHNYIGTEHLLLGIAREGGTGTALLAGFDVGLDDVRSRVGPLQGEEVSGQIAFSPRARQTLEMALHASIELGDAYIGTEHLLLGLMADRDGSGARLLDDLGVSLVAIRARIEAERPGPRTPEHDLGYDAVVGELRAWEGRGVTVILWPTAAVIERPYRGRLVFEADQSDSNRATFTVPTDPPDDRLGNPTGITFALRRDDFDNGRWVGGPERGAGLSFVQRATRVAVFPD